MIQLRNIEVIGVLFAIVLAFNTGVFGQEPENSEKELKNTIRVNITNPLIISSKYIVVGYERVLKNNQTISFNIGQFSLPKFYDTTYANQLSIQKDYKDRGFNFSVDYRFYLQKENKYPAPHGVYIGPFTSYNYFNRENKWILDGGSIDYEVNTNLKFNIFSLGAQLGYQFIFWKRLTLDMVLLGPGIGFYNFDIEINSSLTSDQESLFFEKLDEFLDDKLPGYSNISDGADFKKNGHSSTTGLAFRYMVLIGYRF